MPTWCPTVEAALAAHFGTPVTLVLDVDDAAPPRRPGAGGPAGRPTPRGGRPAVPERATTTSTTSTRPTCSIDAPDADADQASAAEARLLEAFPGASEVAG